VVKPPGHRRYLRTQLKRMAALSAAGDSDGAWECFRLLPVETRAVMSLVMFYGRCTRPWSAGPTREEVERYRRYYRCCCGTYLSAPGREPVTPAVASPEVLTVGILSCARCRGTQWDVQAHALPGETVGEARARLGHMP
jgi:hypothetical protein